MSTDEVCNTLRIYYYRTLLCITRSDDLALYLRLAAHDNKNLLLLRNVFDDQEYKNMLLKLQVISIVGVFFCL